jgi:integrase
MRANITKSIVEKLPPNEWIWCTALSGFGARRQKDAIVYYVRWQRDGRQRMRALGRHGALTPDTARTLAKQALGEIAKGRDPFPTANGGESFGEQVPRFLDRQRPRLRPRNLIDVERYLTRHSAALHHMPLSKIGRRDIAALLAEVERASGPVARNRLRITLSTFFAFAIAEGFTETNPVRGTDKAHEHSRDRVLSDGELAAVWQALPAGDYRDLVKLLVLIGARRRELGDLTWSEVSLPERLIRLPASRVKNKRPYEIPLSEMAFDIIEARWRSGRAKGNGKAAVFGRGGRGFAAWAYGKARLDRRLPEGMPPFVIHDLRRSVASGMARLGINLPVIERVLNHVSGSFAGIVGVYQRHDFAEEKRAALELWAAHLAKIVAEPAGTPVALTSEISGVRETPVIS